MAKKCLVDGCNRQVWAKKYCDYHQYLRTDKKKNNKKVSIRVEGMVQSIRQILETARSVFNRWIRQRDGKEGCISCVNGKVEEAGHYYSAGKYPALRFNDINTNGQCLNCNRHLEGNLVSYREGLIAKYGIDKIEELDKLAQLHRGPYKWDADEVRKIIKQYR